MIPMFIRQIIGVKSLKNTLNYGANRIRYLSPVPAGSRLRGRVAIIAADDVPLSRKLTDRRRQSWAAWVNKLRQKKRPPSGTAAFHLVLEEGPKHRCQNGWDMLDLFLIAGRFNRYGSKSSKPPFPSRCSNLQT